MRESIAQLKKGILIGIGFLIPLTVAGLVADGLNTFSAGDSISAAKINANFEKMPPVGAVIAWHKNLTGVTTTLPAGWVECDGSVVSDSESALNGVTLPDLNGTARFLRGGATSGTLQNATRVLSIAEIGVNNEIIWGRNTAAIYPSDYDSQEDEGTLGRNFIRLGVAPNHHHVTEIGVNHRPDWYRVRSINMSVVWIIRIK